MNYTFWHILSYKLQRTSSLWYKSNDVGFIQNIHIWPSCGQKIACMHIHGHRFFGHISAFFGQLGWNFYGSSEDNYLSIDDEKSKLWCLLFIFDFCTTFGGKMGVATTRTLNGLGPPNPTRKLAHWVDPPSLNNIL